MTGMPACEAGRPGHSLGWTHFACKDDGPVVGVVGVVGVHGQGLFKVCLGLLQVIQGKVHQTPAACRCGLRVVQGSANPCSMQVRGAC